MDRMKYHASCLKFSDEIRIPQQFADQIFIRENCQNYFRRVFFLPNPICSVTEREIDCFQGTLFGMTHRVMLTCFLQFSAAEKISLPYGKSKKEYHQTFLPVLAVVKWGNESN